MIRNKKLLITILTVILALALFSIPAFAAETQDPNAIKVSLDGKYLNFEVQPTIIDGTTLVPVRTIFEALGAKVEWLGSSKTVVGTKGDTKVRLIIDNQDALVNSKFITLEVPAKIIDGSTLVPARFIAESLGADVKWDGNTRTVSISSGSVITFSDTNLEAVVRSAIKKNKGNIVTSDVKVITKLEAENKKITNLNGIQFFTNLEFLELNNNSISDLTPLAALKSLEFLSLGKNQIKDISPLKDLSNLQYLYLNTNYINDINAIRPLTGLTHLSLGNNNISDIKPLGSLTKLEQLFLWNTQVSDISPLKDLANLTYLNLYDNSIIDISPIKSLSKLTTFYLENPDKKQEINDNLFRRYEAMTTKAKSIISEVIKPGMSELDKELALHDYLVTHIKYDKVNFDKRTMPEESHSPVGFFEKGIAVCDGYAKALKILLNMVGVQCLVVSRGDTLESVDDKMGHAWNIVQISGQYYHLDATWNDSSSRGVTDRLSHDFFNLSDRQILASHVFDMNKYPRCTNDSPAYNDLIESYRFARFAGDWLFTINDEGYIFKVDLKNGTNQKVSNDKATSLDYFNNWIVFTNSSDNYRLYKMKTDGSGKIKLHDDIPISFKVVGGNIYYINSTNADKKIYRITMDGSSKTFLTLDDITSFFSFYNGQIYYRAYSWAVGAKLYRMNPDGTSRTNIINDNIPGFVRKGPEANVSFSLSNLECYDKTYVYYINISDSDRLYKVKLDGTDRMKLSDDSCSNLEIVGDWIYYANLTDNKYYRVKTDGTQRQAIG